MFGNSRMTDVDIPVGASGPRTRQPCAIHAEHDVQVLEAHFLEELVEAAFQERPVDVHDRDHTGFRHAARERNRVAPQIPTGR